jgi:cell division protein FtsI (penicillin-binding protein 3)/stage V sporulation protein D (sporulation-specific penicillin-binding protein)
MGHEMMATPVQMTAAMSAVINGGNFMRPQLVREVRDAEGNVLRRFAPQVERQVINPGVSREVVQALVSVVSKEGTARQAAVPGFIAGGKTGTTEKWDNEAKSYKTGKYVSSFIGFLPADDPQFVICIMVDEPKAGRHYGGEVAAPAFAAMARRIAQHMDLVPELPEAAPVVTTLRPSSAEAP